jgi:hypothetical protein
MTRALQHHTTGLPMALRASESSIRTAEHEGKFPGIAQLGKEEAAKSLKAEMALLDVDTGTYTLYTDIVSEQCSDD